MRVTFANPKHQGSGKAYHPMNPVTVMESQPADNLKYHYRSHPPGGTPTTGNRLNSQPPLGTTAYHMQCRSGKPANASCRCS